MRTVAIVALGIILFASDPGHAQTLKYLVTFEEAQAHYVHVELEITPNGGGELVVFLPVWTPGSYLVREFAQHIDSLEAEEQGGGTLPVRKRAKSEWVISTPTEQPIKIRYRIYCNDLSVRTNFADSEFAILNGAATFITCQDHLADRHEVRLTLPENWAQSASSMHGDANSPPHSFMAENYDELVDAPILVGNPRLHPFQVGGVTHYLVNQGGDDLWDGAKAATDVAKIVAEHQRMWGQVPYDRYFFLNLITESGGGLEHDNSTVLMTSRWSYRSPQSYRRWLGLVSHEFFHAWNVRRLRPAALMQYDYLGENYFDELWVAEGVTSYYDDLALVRCGLSSPKEYLAALSRNISALQSTPGRMRQSLTEASHDSWIKFYRPNENSRNTSISYYTKGAIVAFLLDAEIRRASGNSKSLDDVMLQLYERYASQRGYTNEDVLRIANEVSGGDLSDWFQRCVYSAEELDYDAALDWLGLQFKGREPAVSQTGDRERDQGQPDAESKQPNDSKRPWLGLSTRTDDGRVVISQIVEDSPAFKAGLNAGDEVIGLNGYRVTSSVDDRLKQYQVGETARLLVSRRGKLQELPVKIGAKPAQSWTLEELKEPSDMQRANLADWLRQEVREEKSED